MPQITDLAASAAALARLHQRPGPTLVLSDFFDAAGCQRGLDALRRSGCEPRIVQILAADDVEPAARGDADLVDAESGTVSRVTLTERSLAEYRRLVGQQQESLRSYARRHRLEHVVLRTDWPAERLLSQGLLLARPPALECGDSSPLFVRQTLLRCKSGDESPHSKGTAAR